MPAQIKAQSIKTPKLLKIGVWKSFYAEAQDELNSNNYTRAVKLYEILESRFPNGRYAQQSQLDTAYAYYKDR